MVRSHEVRIKFILVSHHEKFTVEKKMYVKAKGYIENLSNYFLDYDNDYVLKWNISGIYSQLLIKNFLKSLSIVLLKKEQVECYTRK